MGGRDAPSLFFKSDKAGLSGEHFNGDTQNARQQLLKIQFLGESAGNFKQVVALANTEIREA